MRKLDPTKQINLTQEALARILQNYGVGDFAYKPIDQGIENTSVFITGGGNRYVVRVYKYEKKTDGDIEFELKFQDYLRENGIPIPLIYKNTEGKELSVVEIDNRRRQVILMEYIEGDTSAPYTPELIMQLSSLQAKMHNLGIAFAKQNPSTSLWKTLRDSYAVTLNKLLYSTIVGYNKNKYSPELQRFIERARAFSYALTTDLTHGYNHLDLDSAGNIIVKDGLINGILDFDDLEYSPCVVCLAYTLWDVLFDSEEEGMKKYLANYQTMRPLTAAEYEVLPHCILFRNYSIGILNLLVRDRDYEMPRILQLEKEIPALFASN